MAVTVGRRGTGAGTVPHPKKMKKGTRKGGSMPTQRLLKTHKKGEFLSRNQKEQPEGGKSGRSKKEQYPMSKEESKKFFVNRKSGTESRILRRGKIGGQIRTGKRMFGDTPFMKSNHRTSERLGGNR